VSRSSQVSSECTIFNFPSTTSSTRKRKSESDRNPRKKPKIENQEHKTENPISKEVEQKVQAWVQSSDAAVQALQQEVNQLKGALRYYEDSEKDNFLGDADIDSYFSFSI